MRPTGTRAIETTASQRPPPGRRPSCRTEGAEPRRDRSPEACGARSGPGQVTQQKTEENPGKSENRRARRGLEATISGRSIGNHGGNLIENEKLCTGARRARSRARRPDAAGNKNRKTRMNRAQQKTHKKEGKWRRPSEFSHSQYAGVRRVAEARGGKDGKL